MRVKEILHGLLFFFCFVFCCLSSVFIESASQSSVMVVGVAVSCVDFVFYVKQSRQKKGIRRRRDHLQRKKMKRK